ncbi:hypothetical protein [Janthinobacterium sp. 17J80-10]|uniref:hypothetical protein n=1 Tax=Janthinobacterium sp. 17J80-10 TaxID=2497863 RepID=UPI0010052AE8|nr:hypothetical protein [Janthinobacterium sp. 17J80-10]QAU34879.1 hypothetical protein EKL02_12170 [Janthinobacterium sp. 17J80-10]
MNGFPRALSVLMLYLFLAQPALAQQDKAADQPRAAAAPTPSAAARSVEDMRTRYPQGSIDSVETAGQAQVDVDSARANLAAQFAIARNDCYDRFFTNSCINSAKEAQRAGLAVLRPIELEANAFLRQARVDKRDHALQELRLKSEREAQERQLVQQDNEKEAARKAEERAGREQQRQADQATRAGMTDNRVQQHEEKLQRLRAEDAGKAQQRVKNVAAYEEKQKEAAERKKKVADKKAEKQARQVGKAAAPAPAPAPAPEPVKPSAPAR